MRRGRPDDYYLSSTQGLTVVTQQSRMRFQRLSEPPECRVRILAGCRFATAVAKPHHHKSAEHACWLSILIISHLALLNKMLYISYYLVISIETFAHLSHCLRFRTIQSFSDIADLRHCGQLQLLPSLFRSLPISMISRSMTHTNVCSLHIFHSSS